MLSRKGECKELYAPKKGGCEEWYCMFYRMLRCQERVGLWDVKNDMLYRVQWIIFCIERWIWRMICCIEWWDVKNGMLYTVDGSDVKNDVLYRMVRFEEWNAL
jgi:hypothetical protein